MLPTPDGARLHVEEAGPPEGPALLLLEGMGGDTLGWRRNIPHFAAAGLRTVAFDFRGSGRSERPPGPYSMAMFVGDTLAVMDGLGIERAHLYGQSMGGFVALNAALEHPGRVRSLVLGCTHAGGPSVVAARRGPPDEGAAAMYARETPREHIEEDLRVARTVPPPLAGAQEPVARGHDVASRLGSIRCPALVVHGEDDRVVDPANGRLLAGRIPGASFLLVPGAGHLYHSERAQEVDARIVAFLRSVP